MNKHPNKRNAFELKVIRQTESNKVDEKPIARLVTADDVVPFHSFSQIGLR